MKHLFIINPVAGKGKPLKIVPEIISFLKDKKVDYSIEFTDYPGHATEIARRYAINDKVRIYSLGGDGTINEIINGMIGSKSSVAIIPAGSGNDLVKTLRQGNHKDLIHRLFHGREKPIDIAAVNGRFFANVSSFGFDAEAAKNTLLIKQNVLIPPHLCHLVGIFITMLKYRNIHLNITIDGEAINTKLFLITIANGKYYGGGIQTAPEAEVDDGLLDICLITAKNIWQVLKTFPRYVKGQHPGTPGVYLYKAKEVKIASDKEITLNIDGEIEKVKEVVFQIIPNKVNVVLPYPEKIDEKAV